MAKKLLEQRKIRRTAAEIKIFRLLMKILPVTAGLLTSVLVVTFVASALYNKYGAFTVTVEKANFVKYGISLCETPDFSAPMSNLNSKASESVTNIDGNGLPDNLNTVNGEHNGTNYIAYTFYLKNMGKETVDISYGIVIANMSLGIEEAVRVRLYSGDYDPTAVNHTDPHVDYAKTKMDGTGPEPGTTEFLSNGVVMQDEIPGMEPGEIKRYTVVIWLEGNDPECIDDILGGVFKVDMEFAILGGSGETEA